METAHRCEVSQAQLGERLSLCIGHVFATPRCQPQEQPSATACVLGPHHSVDQMATCRRHRRLHLGAPRWPHAQTEALLCHHRNPAARPKCGCIKIPRVCRLGPCSQSTQRHPFHAHRPRRFRMPKPPVPVLVFANRTVHTSLRWNRLKCRQAQPTSLNRCDPVRPGFGHSKSQHHQGHPSPR